MLEVIPWLGVGIHKCDRVPPSAALARNLRTGEALPQEAGQGVSGDWGSAISFHECLLGQALEKALHPPAPNLHSPSLPPAPKTIWGKGSDARSFFMASWPWSQRAGDWVVWAEFLSLPVRSLQLVNMKPGAGRIWPLSCQQSTHLESRKVVLLELLGAGPRALPPHPGGQWTPHLRVWDSLCLSPHPSHQPPVLLTCCCH